MTAKRLQPSFIILSRKCSGACLKRVSAPARYRRPLPDRDKIMNTYHATSTAYTHRAETGAARYGIRTSRGIYPPVADFAPSHRNPHPMRYGDRLNIRLRFADGSENVINTDRVADLTELVGEVRQSARRRRGLVRMSVRNLTRGWTLEKPLMLYGDAYPQPSRYRVNVTL